MISVANKNKGFQYNKRVNKAVGNVKKQYQNYQKKYNANVNAQMKRDVNASNAQYDVNAQQAALRNAVQQRELQRQMYRNGITGGATETSLMNAANNYANQQGKIASDKVASANTIRNKAAADRASFALSNAQARDTAIQSAKDRVETKYQNWLKRKDTKENTRWQRKWDRNERRYSRRWNQNERKYSRMVDRYNRYATTVGGYDTVKKVNREIKRIKKSGKNLWRLAYLRKQRADIRERDYQRAHSK